MTLTDRGSLPLATVAAGPDGGLDGRVAALGPDTKAAVEEFLAAAEDIAAAGGSGPTLRQVLQRVFVRSVNEFFTARSGSMQLPREFLGYTRAAAGDNAVPLGGDFPEREALLDDVLRARRSIRDYAKEPMELATLASVLRAAVGKVGEEDGYGVRALPLFPYPSTGGLSAFEVGVLAQRVDGLEPGYYLYDQVGYQLVPRIRGDLRLALQDVTFESEWLLYAPVVLVLVHRARKFEWKYHTRGYRMAHLDMGAALQNLYLSAWASRVGTCAVAGFFDEAINTLLGYDGIDDYVSLVVAMGEPATPLLSQQE
jgi:SagB-type dehydrogenase family enzyme